MTTKPDKAHTLRTHNPSSMVKNLPEDRGHENPESLTYGTYLRISELLQLQSPLSSPQVHGEMLFIVVQQAQELWFKQMLHDLRLTMNVLQRGELQEAAHILDRVNRIFRALAEQVDILEGLPPIDFQRFRGYLKTASGFESEQFRELELASGLSSENFVRMASRMVDYPAVRSRWPVTLHEALLEILGAVATDPVEALVQIYENANEHPDLYRLAEALSEYEIRFSVWRFHHMKLVERIIGGRAAGTGGSSGGAYLGKTLDYRFFPELWEARNQLTARGTAALS